jgi:leucyl aminopeptidase
MNLLYNVGKAANSAPRLIHLRYNNGGDGKRFAIVGKGVTFDTGGLNLKPTNFIEDMYLDKAGACATLGLFKFIVDQQLPINISCMLALAENAIDSKSYKPSDILESKKGLTVEIGNTDAEGRLCMADAMTFV